METIIAFVMDNLFFLVIAAGFLLSLLGKAGKRTPRMPDFGGGGRDVTTLGRHRGEREDEPRGAVPAAPAPRRMNVPVSPSAQAVPRASAFGEGSPGSEGAPGARGADRPPRPARLPVKPAAAAKPDIGADELRQAVVWAEILGPPRARAPYGRRQK